MPEIPVNKISDFLWEIPKQSAMNVPGRVYASERMLDDIRSDKSLEQVMNVAH
jgi:tRNA-splicing ligase RtcB